MEETHVYTCAPSLPLKEDTIYATQNRTYAVLGLISGCLVMGFSH